MLPVKTRDRPSASPKPENLREVCGRQLRGGLTMSRIYPGGFATDGDKLVSNCLNEKVTLRT
ncbi:hypothetical protein IQ270_06375 [Microcoleus sp. LEGE 07076]|uniref:hypothetical protein n=1 Tax=Microcoleus sp. LEGE 07076 TaxID=915322 RepID=UPI00187FEAC7|nr:hypothetical protein [Microcoleus sp. LEGE 07076]MBE9184355.1 hypothetical protein [Microcoleus sp. LEGE 07076]